MGKAMVTTKLMEPTYALLRVPKTSRLIAWRKREGELDVGIELAG